MGISVGEGKVTKIDIGEIESKQRYDNNILAYGKGSKKTFSKTGAEQSWTVPVTGKYTLEVWGAEGGKSSGRATYDGGKGGYACGIVTLQAGTVLKIYVGGKGQDNAGGLTAEAFNGGGKGGYSNYNSSNDRNGGGGGASDIRIGGNTLYDRLIVAGGGAGGHAYSNYYDTLYGGGETGGVGGGGRGGTQTGGGAFGIGGSSSSNGEGNRWCMNGGGGGWYGGMGQAASSSDSWRADFVSGGGSGFVWTGQEEVPAGYLVSEDYILSDTQNIAGNQEMPNPEGGTMTGNTGDGLVVINSRVFLPQYQKVTEPGVYHNEELGLISMSADGEHWVTIDDKNVGAWSNGIEDELSYGGYFQFGNIHGFGVLPEPEPEPEPTPPREPGENTICYFPFLTDALDAQENRTLTLGGCSVTDGALTITAQSQYALLNSGITNSEITVSLWYNPTVFNSGSWNTILCRQGGVYHHLLINGGGDSGTAVGLIGFYNSAWYPSNKVLSVGQWYHIVIVKNGTNEKIYVNKELVLDSNSSFDNALANLDIIGNYDTTPQQGAQGKISRMIIESGSWTQDDIDNYYEWFKEFYGIE